MGQKTVGVTLPKGFFAAGASAGIKKNDRLDMALITSEVPCKLAGTFTKNQVKAAPVKWDQAIVKESGIAQAVVCNSGVANACTGADGMLACEETAETAAELLGLKKEAVLVASTGVIGAQIPTDKIKAGITKLVPQLSDEAASANEAARAIMTTDTREKEVGVQFELDGVTVSIGGMCKGSGMIHPNMCTMLAFVTTDVAISQPLLQKALLAVVDETYNMISVDGDTSTNDTVLLLANGMAGNAEITEEGPAYDAFLAALMELNCQLAKMIAGDGEGATALFEVVVRGAADKASAATLARSVVSSTLTKAAICGHDANWGRILCALGYAGVEIDADAVALTIRSAAGSLQIVEGGQACDYSEEEATRILSEPEVTVVADMHMGDAEATAWGCDLTHEYVSINADYRS